MIDHEQNDEMFLDTLKDLSGKNKGTLGFILHLKAENRTVKRIRASKIGVGASKSFIQSLRDVFGNSNVWIN